MRSLSATLLEAQRAGSARPYVRVRVLDRDVGVVRLRWQRWYSGTEPDGPCAAAVPADGSLLRARIDPSDGGLKHQRVAAPAATRDYSAWTALATVDVAARLGLAAAGTRALLATARNADAVEVRESTDSGASFGAASLVATAAATVTAVACGLQVDGSAAVIFAAAGTVYACTRSGTGAWSAPVAWTQSLATINGLATLHEGDYFTLVSGTNGSGEAAVWSTRLGDGATGPPGNWATLMEVALASANTDVTYRVTALARIDTPRAALVESFSGTGSYDRVHTASGVGETGHAEFLWREPVPFDHSSAYGLAFAAGPTDGWLAAPDGVWNAAPDFGDVTLNDELTDVDLDASPELGRLRLVLRNDDGRYNAGVAPVGLEPGGELRLDLGYVTGNGNEWSEGPRFWITGLRRSRAGGRSLVTLDAVDGWGVLRSWVAPRQMLWAAGELNAFQLLQAIGARAGLRVAIQQGSAELGFSRAFTVRAGERAATAIARLVRTLPEELYARGLFLMLDEPRTGDPTDYAYGDGHAVLRLEASAGQPPAGWARVFGAGIFAQAVDEQALLAGAGIVIAVDDNLTAQARADARALTLLRQAALDPSRGSVTILPNAGQELGDVVEVTDAQLALSAQRFRVRALSLRYTRSAARPRYDMTLALTEV